MSPAAVKPASCVPTIWCGSVVRSIVRSCLASSDSMVKTRERRRGRFVFAFRRLKKSCVLREISFQELLNQPMIRTSREAVCKPNRAQSTPGASRGYATGSESEFGFLQQGGMTIASHASRNLADFGI